MNLVIPAFKLATVVNVRTPDRSASGEGNRARGTFARADVTTAVILITQSAIAGDGPAVQEVHSVAGRDGVAEAQQPIARITQLRQLRCRQHPDPDAITVSRWCGSLGM